MWKLFYSGVVSWCHLVVVISNCKHLKLNFLSMVIIFKTKKSLEIITINRVLSVQHKQEDLIQSFVC